MKPSTIPIVVEQHAEEAAFLWHQRDAAVRAPHYRLTHLARLDERVEAHIDGLRVAGEDGWALYEQALAEAGGGEVFAAGVLALESKKLERIEKVYAAAELTPDCGRGLVSAFGWVAPKNLQGTARDLLASPSAYKRRLGIAACAVHRVDPGEALNNAAVDADPLLQAHALRAAGELGRKDLLPRLNEQIEGNDVGCCFWSAWSSVLLGNRNRAATYLINLCFEAGPFRAASMQLVLRALEVQRSHECLKRLANDSADKRALIEGAGIVGDPSYVPWLLKQIENPEYARRAGESVTFITGLDISLLDLEGKPPDNFETGPNDDPENDNVDMDPDDDLPWPDVAKLTDWWAKNSGRYQAGTRYFMGEPVNEAHCLKVLKDGYQRQRIAAAIYLSLLRPGTPLFNTAAPAWRQKAALAKLSVT